MTEQKQCVRCGRAGHRSSQCDWPIVTPTDSQSRQDETVRVLQATLATQQRHIARATTQQRYE